MLSEYIIKGNAAIIKCNIPSFLTDFAKVETWLGSDGQEFTYEKSETNYGTIDDLLCFSLSISFLVVICWTFVDFSLQIVVNQFYDPTTLDKEYVMRGNSAILKCSIPSFVADFVHVVSWIDEEGHEYLPSSEGNFNGGKENN